ncbi:hypothetical protein [Sneathiella aquimaris]|uniref:hypothetical protein n=1 Tax=Sneathiella aquimaris TaxID=2599305 RepID=UPI00146B1E0A|nr:hypothetical protein [Sneathiella aquimaris]
MTRTKALSRWAFCLLAVASLTACNEGTDGSVVLNYENMRDMQTVSGGVKRWDIPSPQFCAFDLTVANNLDEVVESLKVSWWADGIRENLRINSYGFKRKNIKLGETTASQPVNVRVSCDQFRQAELRIEQCTTSLKTCAETVIERGRFD